MSVPNGEPKGSDVIPEEVKEPLLPSNNDNAPLSIEPMSIGTNKSSPPVQSTFRILQTVASLSPSSNQPSYRLSFNDKESLTNSLQKLASEIWQSFSAAALSPKSGETKSQSVWVDVDLRIGMQRSSIGSISIPRDSIGSNESLPEGRGSMNMSFSRDSVTEVRDVRQLTEHAKLLTQIAQLHVKISELEKKQIELETRPVTAQEERIEVLTRENELFRSRLEQREKEYLELTQQYGRLVHAGTVVSTSTGVDGSVVEKETIDLKTMLAEQCDDLKLELTALQEKHEKLQDQYKKLQEQYDNLAVLHKKS